MALHAGTLLALSLGRRRAPADELRPLDPGALWVIALGSAPAGLAGLALERRIESRLGTPATIAAGLLAGALAMVLADRAPEERSAADAGAADGLWLGLAQACALVPGISRSGATITAARIRRFRREDAAILARRLGLPVIAGATGLKAWRLREPALQAHGRALAVGALSSFASTLLAGRLTTLRRERSLLPYAAYRTALAGVIAVRLARRPDAHR